MQDPRIGTKAQIKSDFARMYREITDPEVQAKNKRDKERRDRIADKRADTGL